MQAMSTTSKNLIIVESPAKAKTIEKFLGKDYQVLSSRGHIRDLSKKDLTIDSKGRFEPEYEVPEEKLPLVKELKKAAGHASMVWLASDEDREGEAISWHLYEVLGLKPENTRRIVFHEITKDAIVHAIENPRDIDINLVDAQQARRVLDRIVGFELSPILWKKIKPALSAGRVQSVAVRLIVERENEIKAFTPEEYYRVTAEMTAPGGETLKLELARRIPSYQDALDLLDALKDAVFTVTDINVKPVKKSPAPPFTTSTLQQEASRKLGFTVSQTMLVAQKLYEAGHITYMRTDSLNLSSLAINTISREICDTLGERYLKVRKYHTPSKGAQEAHEAIRPTYIDKHSIDGTAQEKKLYNLIWKRTIASQMADAELERTTVDVMPQSQSGEAINARFTTDGEVIKFDGFLKVYIEGRDDENGDSPVTFGDSTLLPPLKSGDRLTAGKIMAQERFTQQPPRYTEASLVKKMEELGIGRPSTYAPTISTIQARDYVEKGEKEGTPRDVRVMTLKGGKVKETMRHETFGAERGKLIPTDIGIVVNDFLTSNFPNILDYNFTADIEGKFDHIAEGKTEWHHEIARFYDVFHPEVEKAENTRTAHKVGERMLGTDPVSGKPVSVKVGRYGPVVQIGDVNSDEKPRFASLQGDQSIFDITLEQALKLFELPRTLGTYEDTEVTVAVGRFGPYVKHNGKFVSIPADLSPAAITLDEAIELIMSKRDAESKKVVKTFDDEPDLQILNGRYGVYISYKKSNYKIPKTVTDPSALTLQECMEIINNQPAKKTVRRKK